MKYNFTSLDRLSTSDVDAIVGMQHYFIDDLTFDVNHFSLSDTFGYVADVGKMLTTRLQHESFADNMAVGFTIGCTNNSRVSLIVNNNKLKSFANTLMYFIFFQLLVLGMGFRRGCWYERSGIEEDAIVALKGIRIEKKIEGTEDWLGHVFDDSCIQVQLFSLLQFLIIMKCGIEIGE